MCGISGIVRLTGNASDIHDRLMIMQQSLRHRGPDDSGIYLGASGTVGLGHTRLSIIDLSPAGHQPMTGSNFRCRITYNGEIYNYRDLRAQLKKESGVWRSQTDTEVLLKSYESCRGGDFGEVTGFLTKLRGMFAFAIWDEELQQLLVARDPFGIKPLYYSADGQTFGFA